MTDDANPFGDISDLGSPDPQPPADSSPFGQPFGEPAPQETQTGATQPPLAATQPPPGYGQPPPGASQPPPAYGQPKPGYVQPGYGQQPGDGQAYPQYGYAPSTETNAIVALILAIASFAMCPFVAAVAALFFAGSASRNIAASGGTKAGLGLVTTARVLSWLNVVLSVMAAIGIAIFLVAARDGGVM